MSKHTPGPWRLSTETVFRQHDRDPKVFVDIHERRIFGSRTSGELNPTAFVAAVICRPEGGLVEQDNANAHLIAAAPELLEACKRALKELTEEGSWSVGLEEDLAAAIAKAEGRDSGESR